MQQFIGADIEGQGEANGRRTAADLSRKKKPRPALSRLSLQIRLVCSRVGCEAELTAGQESRRQNRGAAS